MSDLLTTAMIGVGNWGGNVLRNLASADRCRVKYLCDSDAAVLSRRASAHPDAKPIADIEIALADPAVDAVVIATEVPTHFALADRALRAGKHVFVEKPMTLHAREAQSLVRLAAERGRKLMVGHLLIHHPAFETLRTLIEAGEIGDLYYMYTHRLNLGIVRSDENAWWSLAPHDVSVICHLFDAEPVSVTAQGQCNLREDIEDVVFATLRFGDGRVGHIHVSWLDPHKIRKMTIVGRRKMVTWDDMSANEKLRVYDKGVAAQDVATFDDALAMHSGDIVIPRIACGEPLKREIQSFVDCCLDDLPVPTDGADGLRVVRVLEAGQRSLKSGGLPVDPRELD